MIRTTDMILGSGVSFSKTREAAEKVIACALGQGIRRFDTAPSYGTEELLGKILEEQCAAQGIPREEIRFQTKIDAWQMQDGGGKNVAEHAENALRKLRTERLDTLLIHWPVPRYMEETWRQMRGLKEKGIVKRIGICNVRMRQLREYIVFGPDVIQIERHPLNVFSEEVDFCRRNGLEIQAYSPLCKMDSRIRDSETIREIMERHGKDQGQVVLRWHLDTGVIPVFTTTKPERLAGYMQLDGFSLADEEIEAINRMNVNYKIYLESVSCPGF